MRNPKRLIEMEWRMEKMEMLRESMKTLENHSIESWKEQRKLIRDLTSLDYDQETIDKMIRDRMDEDEESTS
ncbi:MAG: hypothetical protein WBX01_13240 [Nitrososphaeraceae archaeon]